MSDQDILCLSIYSQVINVSVTDRSIQQQMQLGMISVFSNRSQYSVTELSIQ